jgi:exonuclease III
MRRECLASAPLHRRVGFRVMDGVEADLARLGACDRVGSAPAPRLPVPPVREGVGQLPVSLAEAEEVARKFAALRGGGASAVATGRAARRRARTRPARPRGRRARWFGEARSAGGRLVPGGRAPAVAKPVGPRVPAPSRRLDQIWVAGWNVAGWDTPPPPVAGIVSPGTVDPAHSWVVGSGRDVCDALQQPWRDGGLQGVDYLGISETHLVGDQQITQVPGYVFFGVNATATGSGRRHVPRSGVGILVRDTLAPFAEFMRSVSTSRMVWIRARQAGSAASVFICSYYAPQSNDSKACDVAYKELDAAVRRFSAIAGAHVIVTGDMNAHTHLRLGPRGDASRTVNPNGSRLIALCDAHGLTAVNAQATATGAWDTRRPSVRAEPGSGTMIDYVLVSSGLAAAVTECDTTWLPSNSDHCPVRVKMDVALVRLRATRKRHARTRFDFKRRSHLFDWEPYEKGCAAALPLFGAACAERQTEGGRSPAELVAAAWESLSATVLSQMRTHVGVSIVTSGGKWWWTPVLKQLNGDKRAAWQRWQRAGSATERVDGREAYVKCRRTYNREIRRASRAREEEECNLAGGLQRSYELSKLYWNLHAERTHQVSVLPQALQDAEGVMITDGDARLRLIGDFMQTRGAPAAADDPKFDPAFYAEKVADVRGYASSSAVSLVPDAPPSEREVLTAMDRLKNWKAGGVDEWVPECITKSDRGAMAVALTTLFGLIWDAESVPDDWRVGAVVLIAKSDADLEPHKLGSYRPLTLMSVASKVLEHVVNTRLHAWAEEGGHIDDAQGGFREARGCGDLVWFLSELLQRRRETATRGGPVRATYVAFLDVADAYGSCDHVMLFARLWEMGVRGTMWRLFRAWYGERRSHVRVDGEVTDDFPTRCGVAQGAVTSPFLYAAFLNGLLAQLRASGLGSWEGGVWAGCHCYADDIALCADTREELEEMLALAAAYAKKWRFVFKATKSKVMVAVPSTRGPDRKADTTGGACEEPTSVATPPSWFRHGELPDTRRAQTVVHAMAAIDGTHAVLAGPTPTCTDGDVTAWVSTLQRRRTDLVEAAKRPRGSSPLTGPQRAAHGRVVKMLATEVARIPAPLRNGWNTPAAVTAAVDSLVRAGVCVDVVGATGQAAPSAVGLAGTGSGVAPRLLALHVDFLPGALRTRGLLGGSSTADYVAALVAAAGSAVCRTLLREAVAIADQARQPVWARPRKHGQCRALFDSPGLGLAHREDDLLHLVDRGPSGSVLTGPPRWLAARNKEGRAGYVATNYVTTGAVDEARWAAFDARARALLDLGEAGKEITIAGGAMRFVVGFRYLGVTIPRDGGWQEMASSMVKASKMRAEKMAFAGMRHGDYAPDTAWYLWNATCAPLLNNAVQVVGYTTAQCKAMDDEIHRVGCSLLGLGRFETPRQFIFGELRQLPTAARQDHLALRFLGHIARMRETRAVKRFFLQRMEDAEGDVACARALRVMDPQSVAATRSWCVRMGAVLYTYNIAYLWTPDALEDVAASKSKKEWEEFTDVHIKHTEGARWRARQLGVDKFNPVYCAIKHRPDFDPYLRGSHRAAPAVRSIARLRAGIVGEVQWGRWCKAPALPREERLCCLCCPDDEPMQRVRRHHLDGLQSASTKRRARALKRRPGVGVDDAAGDDDWRAGERVPALGADLLPAYFFTDVTLPGAEGFAAQRRRDPFVVGGRVGDTLHILGACPALEANRRRLWAAVCDALVRGAGLGEVHGVNLARRLGDEHAGGDRLLLLLGTAPAWWPAWAEPLTRTILSLGTHDLLMRWEVLQAALSYPLSDTEAEDRGRSTDGVATDVEIPFSTVAAYGCGGAEGCGGP